MPDCTQSHTHLLTHTLARSHTHTQTNTLITILSSSAFASPTRSRSLLSTTNTSPWNHNRGREGGREQGREGIGEGKEGVVMCDLNYIVFQAVPECFGSNVSTVVLYLILFTDVPNCETDVLILDCLNIETCIVAERSVIMYACVLCCKVFVVIC